MLTNVRHAASRIRAREDGWRQVAGDHRRDAGLDRGSVGPDQERDTANRARIERKSIARRNRLLSGADYFWTQAEGVKAKGETLRFGSASGYSYCRALG